MTTQPDPPSRPLRAPTGYPFPSSPEGPSWAEVEARLASAQNYWLCTATPDGRPHVTPVWGVWVDRTLFFDGQPTTRWGRNLTANPRAAVHLESAAEVVTVEGQVSDGQTTAAHGDRVIAAWTEKYGRLAPDPVGDGIFYLRPRVVRAFAGSLQSGCAWDLEG